MDKPRESHYPVPAAPHGTVVAPPATTDGLFTDPTLRLLNAVEVLAGDRQQLETLGWQRRLTVACERVAFLALWATGVSVQPVWPEVWGPALLFAAFILLTRLLLVAVLDGEIQQTRARLSDDTRAAHQALADCDGLLEP